MSKVFLREKKLLHGKKGLYLDFYPPIINPETGKPTRREHLKLNVYSRPANQSEKDHNKEMRLLGEAIRAQRMIDIKNENYGFLSSARRQKDKDFLAYFRQIADSKKSGSKSNFDNWHSALKHLEKFVKNACTFAQVNEDFCRRFKDYLLTESKLSRNSCSSYFTKFQIVCRQAAEEKLFPENPCRKVKSIQPPETQREFLTIEELQLLAATPFPEYEDLRRAALFSALAGLRWSDIFKLTWREVEHSKAGGGSYVRFIQKKTEGAETLPIGDEARELLGDEGAPDEKVFPALKYYQCGHLRLWFVRAGINKNITFHSFRHTYATAQLTLGSDLYTVSKLLGHKNVQTTQIYARVIDQKKRDAANKITLK